jgi:predicted lipid-binding transport protein (Tim44 family)
MMANMIVGLLDALGLPALRLPRGSSVGTIAACQEHRVHTGYMGRIIGTILGAILAIWLAVTAAGGIFATLKTFLIIGLIALAVFIVVWFVAGRPRRS